VTEFWVEFEVDPTPGPTERWEGDVLPELGLLGIDEALMLVPELARSGEGGGRGICERALLAIEVLEREVRRLASARSTRLL